MVRVTCVSRYRRQLVDDKCNEAISGGRRTEGGRTRAEMEAGKGGAWGRGAWRQREGGWGFVSEYVCVREREREKERERERAREREREPKWRGRDHKCSVPRMVHSILFPVGNKGEQTRVKVHSMVNVFG